MRKSNFTPKQILQTMRQAESGSTTEGGGHRSHAR